MQRKPTRYYVLSWIQHFTNPSMKPRRERGLFNSNDYHPGSHRPKRGPRSKLHHGTGESSYQHVPKRLKILEDFGTISDFFIAHREDCLERFKANRREDFDRDSSYHIEAMREVVLELIELFYFKKYFELERWEEGHEVSGGWLAPNGDYYPCEEEHHQGLATIITAHLFNRVENDRYLEKEGWFHVMAQGYVQGIHNREATTKQRATLMILFTKAVEQDQKEFARNIYPSIMEEIELSPLALRKV